MINPLLKALNELGGQAQYEDVKKRVVLPRGIMEDERGPAVEHAAEYLVAGEYLTREGGEWCLTAAGKSLQTPLLRDDIEDVKRAGHIRWYKKPYTIPDGADL